MKQIIKYDLQPLLNDIEMPSGSEVLGVSVEGIRPFLYVLGNPDLPTVVRRFVATRTGQEVPDDPRVKFLKKKALAYPGNSANIKRNLWRSTR